MTTEHTPDDAIPYTSIEDDLRALDKLNDANTVRRDSNLSILEAAILQKRDVLLGSDLDACKSVLEMMSVHDRLMSSNEKARVSRASAKIKVKEADQQDRTNAMVLDMFQLIATGQAPMVKVPAAGQIEDVEAAKTAILDVLAAEGVDVQESELRMNPDDLA